MGNEVNATALLAAQDNLDVTLSVLGSGEDSARHAGGKSKHAPWRSHHPKRGAPCRLPSRLPLPDLPLYRLAATSRAQPRVTSRLRPPQQPLPASPAPLPPCPADVSNNQLLAAAGVAVGGTTRVALSLAEGSSLRGNQAFLAGLLLGGGDGDLSVQLAASNDTDNGVVLVGAARASPLGLYHLACRHLLLRRQMGQGRN